MILIIASLVLLAAVLAVGTYLNSRPFGKLTGLANDGALTVGIHKDGKNTYFHDGAPITTRFLLVKQGSADNHVAAITATTDIPVGVCQDEPAATTDPVGVNALGGAEGSMKMVAAAAIAAGAIVTSSNNGKIVTLGGTGTYWMVGVALTTAAANGDLVEVSPSFARIVVP